MARKSRNTRDNRVIANRPRLGLRPLSSLFSTGVSRQIEDRRLFHPDGYSRPASSFQSFNHRLRASPSRKLPFGVGFVSPSKVLVCVRRKIRREVMFAKGGAGSRRMSRPRRSYYSDVRC